jgi:hypothetical protein
VLTLAQILERERAEASTPPPLDPATLPDRILCALDEMPDAHLENGCLWPGLIKHLGMAAQLDKTGLREDDLIALIHRAVATADASRYTLTAPPLDDPLGPERTIRLTTLPRFMRRLSSWDRMRFWRTEAGAPDPEAKEDRNEPATKAAPASTATAEALQSPTEARIEGAEAPPIFTQPAEETGPATAEEEDEEEGEIEAPDSNAAKEEIEAHTEEEGKSAPKPKHAGGRPKEWDWKELHDRWTLAGRTFPNEIALWRAARQEVLRIDRRQNVGRPKMATVKLGVTELGVEEVEYDFKKFLDAGKK